MKKTVTTITAKNNGSSNNNDNKKLNVCAYCRVSTESDEQLNSLAVQRAYFDNLISNHSDWNYVGIYYDEGISGTNLKKRNGFNRMIADALAGKIDLIIVKSISRFARNTVDALQTIRTLKNNDIRVFFEKEQIDSNDIKSEFMLTIMSSFAQEESQSISENVKWASRKLMAKGYVHISYSTFLGYKRKDKFEMEIDKEQAKIVVFIYDSFLHGSSLSSIAKALKENNVPTPSGLDSSHWSKNNISSILRNEKYCGDAILQKTYIKSFLTHKAVVNNGELPKYYVRNNHEAIIPRATWNLTQEILSKDNQRSNVTRYGFLMRCSICGKLYHRYQLHHDYYKDTIQCYRCLGKYDKTTNCNNIRLFEFQLDELYHEVIINLFNYYGNEIKSYFELTIPKVIDGKRRYNKVIKIIKTTTSFSQSQYELDSLKIVVSKMIIKPEKNIDFEISDGNTISIPVPKWSLIKHYNRRKNNNDE